MKYKNRVQQAREKFLKQKLLSAKEQSIIDKDFLGKDYAHYQSLDENEILLPEQYLAEATFHKIEPILNEKPTRFSLLKYAAVVVVLISITIGLYYKNTYPEIITVSTSCGEKKRVILPDGSEVMLNSLSSVSYPKKMNDDVREVLLEGEALFDVMKDVERTFIVKVPQQIEVKVLGTEFNISAYAEDEEIITSLYKGAVSIALNSGEIFQLQPGEKAVYNRSSRSVDIEGIEEETQHWTECSLCFNHKPLNEILRILEREKNIIFDISDEINKELRITANFSSDESINDVLEILSQSGNFSYTEKENRYIINAPKDEIE